MPRASDGHLFCPCTFLRMKEISRRNGALWKLGFRSRTAYDDYLLGPHWVAFRKRVLEGRPNCESCGAVKSLQVHHLNYDRLGDERLEDVAVLCLDCHERAHGRKFTPPAVGTKAP